MVNDTQKITKRPPKHSNNKVKRILYDETFVSQQLREMLAQILEDETITSRAQLFLTRTYSSARFSDWKRKYSTNKNIREYTKKIEEIIEARLVKQGLAGKSIPMTIFLLKNYYGYTDQYQHKVDETVTFKVTRGRAPIEAEVVPLKTIPNHTKRPS